MLRYFRHINVNPLTLHFSGPMEKLEEAYQNDYLDASLTNIRVSLMVAFVFYGIFGFLDALLLPEKKELIWLIRFGFVCPASFRCHRYDLL